MMIATPKAAFTNGTITLVRRSDRVTILLPTRSIVDRELRVAIGVGWRY